MSAALPLRSWLRAALRLGYPRVDLVPLVRECRRGGAVVRVTRDAITLVTADRAGSGVDADGRPWATCTPGARTRCYHPDAGAVAWVRERALDDGAAPAVDAATRAA